MESAEASGKTVEDALNRALKQLGANRDEVEFVVVDEGRKGLFGRGGRDATVRVDRLSGSDTAPASDAERPDTRVPRPAAGATSPSTEARHRAAPRIDGAQPLATLGYIAIRYAKRDARRVLRKHRPAPTRVPQQAESDN